MKKELFSYRRAGGGVLREYVTDDGPVFDYYDDGFSDSIAFYPPEAPKAPEGRLYLEHSLDEVVASGRDLLGEELRRIGREFTYDDIRGVLPKIEEDAYCYLGGVSSQGCLIVDGYSRVYPQRSARDRAPEALFSPKMLDASLSGIKPRQNMLGGEIPMLLSRFDTPDGLIELLYFCEPCDSDRDPILWIRIKRTVGGEPSFGYKVATISRELPFEEMWKREISDEIFFEALADTVAYWLKQRARGARFNLPTDELMRVANGAQLFAKIGCTADRPHYGHKFYGHELHDNFPPNFIWYIEGMITLGRENEARRAFDQLLLYSLSDEGRFVYRQGASLKLGASASEYGMLLFIAGKYSEKLGIRQRPDYTERLIGMGNIILANTVKCPELEDLLLVKMCAEADNNERVNVYLSNNLWAIRGLRALGSLCTGEKSGYYANTADIIEQNINYLIDKYSVKTEAFGEVAPFRLGYPTVPYTLSNCEEFSVPVSDAERDRYFSYKKGRRDYDVTEQEITENTYANYRYYPEALSAMLLDEKYAEGIERMRESIGGELLSMTRFRDWVNDWPVLHHARYLIETDRRDKFLMLLYAHTQHHGRAELLCYYEQVKIYGKVSAHDCLPSLMTTPIMTAWCYLYECMDGGLKLMAAVPDSEYSLPFSISCIGYSGGVAKVNSDGRNLEFTFDTPIPEGSAIYLPVDLRITDPDALITARMGRRAELRAGVRRLRLTFER